MEARRIYCYLLAITIATLNADAACADDDAKIKSALSTLTAETLLNHVKVLSSDAFEGRAPGTPGEQRTVDYLVAQFKQFGLQPGNPEGTYLQDVPLVGFISKPTVSFTARTEHL